MAATDGRDCQFGRSIRLFNASLLAANLIVAFIRYTLAFAQTLGTLQTNDGLPLPLGEFSRMLLLSVAFGVWIRNRFTDQEHALFALVLIGMAAVLLGFAGGVKVIGVAATLVCIIWLAGRGLATFERK